jgi:hypothetical protein
MPAPQSVRVVFSKGSQAGGGEAACPSIRQGRLFKGGPGRKREAACPSIRQGLLFKGGPGCKKVNCLRITCITYFTLNQPTNHKCVLILTSHCTGHLIYIFPKMKLRDLVPSFCERFIFPRTSLSIWLQKNR